VENLGVNVDKKQLLRKSLAQNLKNHLEQIDDLVRHVSPSRIKIKSDGSPVTELDEVLSTFMEAIAGSNYPHASFYSEEKLGTWTFPLLVLDPLDGTREYIEQRPEWVISLALFATSSFIGEGWIYNPVKHELFTHDVPEYKFENKDFFEGEVSRSEWATQLFLKDYAGRKFRINPMGSIAYKLGRLAYQKSDFVVSLKPKNIWDIAGGTLLCQEAGLKFYSEGKQVTSVEKLYQPPLIWCHEELFPELSEIFPSRDKDL
jgi:myo-inositol-1(or 4)-monophosphatase